MIWLVFAALTVSAIFAVLWPLARSASKALEDEADVAFYRAQIAEIRAELARGAIDAEAAKAASAIAARRLLAVAPGEVGTLHSTSARKKMAAAMVVVLIPAVALGFYGRLGRPELRDQPLSARPELGAIRADLAKGAEIEAHVARRPEDGAAFERMAEVEQRAGRWSEAARARGEALRLLGETPERLTRYAEALAYAADGVVTPDAIAPLERALALDSHWPEARYLLGLAAAQHDDVARARDVWTVLAGELPAGSSLRQAVEQNLSMLDAPAEGGPTEAQIRDMVEGLARRLAAGGGAVEDWERLIRSYVALKETARAQAAWAEAKKARGSDGDAMKRLNTLADALGLKKD